MASHLPDGSDSALNPMADVPSSGIPDSYFPLRNEFEHITRKMYTQNLALSETNRTLTILRAIDLLILESKRDLPHLSVNISEAIVNSSSYLMAGMMSLNRHNDRLVNMQGFSFGKAEANDAVDGQGAAA